MADKMSARSDASFDILDSFLSEEVRGKPGELDSYLGSLANVKIDGTQTTVHCKYLHLNGKQLPRVTELAEFLAHQVLEYVIPKDKIAEAAEYALKYKSDSQKSRLRTQAKSLFATMDGNSGEGGEILLYSLIERYLEIPQLICKMPLKTSGKTHYHGIDALHAKVDSKNQKLLLYWGESKLHKTLNGALKDCYKTIAPFLLSTGGAGSRDRRDIELIRENVVLSDPNAQRAILAMLDPDNSLSRNIEYRAVCLVGFDYKKYPKIAMTVTPEKVLSEINKAYSRWSKTVDRRVAKVADLTNFVIEVIVLPLPDTRKFREEFLSQLKQT